MSTAAAVAATIRQQIGFGILASLGARDFRHGNICATREATPLPSMLFNATILPMTKAGRGTAARTMSVTISLNLHDYYDITVSHHQRGDRYGHLPSVIHFAATDVDADTLPRLMLALDYDGREVLNPRLAGAYAAVAA